MKLVYIGDISPVAMKLEGRRYELSKGDTVELLNMELIEELANSGRFMLVENKYVDKTQINIQETMPVRVLHKIPVVNVPKKAKRKNSKTFIQ